MIRGASLGVAMANANEQVREAADWIAPSNNEDGVATFDRPLAGSALRACSQQSGPATASPSFRK